MESQEPVLSVGEVGANTVSRVGDQVFCLGRRGKPTLLKQNNSGKPPIIQVPEVYRRDAAFIVPRGHRYEVSAFGVSGD